MKRFILLASLGLLFFAALSGQPVSAHEVESGGPVSALIHIEPNDQPIAGEGSRILIEVKSNDDDEPFDLRQCDCRVVITEGGNTVYDNPLVAQDEREGWFSFIFPRRSIYTVKLEGTPKKGSDFPSFTVPFSVSVSHDIFDTKLALWGTRALQQLGSGVLTGLAPLIFLAYIIREKFRLRKQGKRV